MSKINAKWHAEHRMPERATAQQRIAWHREHSEHCACRPIPKGVLALMAACNVEAPNPSIERTATGGLRPPASAAHVKRWASAIVDRQVGEASAGAALVK